MSLKTLLIIYLFINMIDYTTGGDSVAISNMEETSAKLHAIRHLGDFKVERTLMSVISMEKASLLCRRKPLLERNFPGFNQCGKAVSMTPDSRYWETGVKGKPSNAVAVGKPLVIKLAFLHT